MIFFWYLISLKFILFEQKHLFNFDFQLSLIYNLSVYELNRQIFKLTYIKKKLNHRLQNMNHNNQNRFFQENEAPNHSNAQLQRCRLNSLMTVTPKKKNIYPWNEPIEIKTTPNLTKTKLSQRQWRWKDNFLNFSNIEHVRVNRARLYNWFVEVCYVFNQSWQTLWSAIFILDNLIIKGGKINVGNIHLYGSTALFIASKYNESSNRINMQSLIHDITYKKFTKEKILKCQSEIFEWFCLSKNRTMHFPTIWDRVFECFPNLCEQKMKKIMAQVFYFWQDPHMMQIQIRALTEKNLVRKAGLAIIDGQRFDNCQEVQKRFFLQYGCTNMKTFGHKLRL